MPIGTIIGFLVGIMFTGAMLNLANHKQTLGAVGNSMFWTSLFALAGTFIEMLVS